MVGIPPAPLRMACKVGYHGALEATEHYSARISTINRNEKTVMHALIDIQYAGKLAVLAELKHVRKEIRKYRKDAASQSAFPRLKLLKLRFKYFVECQAGLESIYKKGIAERVDPWKKEAKYWAAYYEKRLYKVDCEMALFLMLLDECPYEPWRQRKEAEVPKKKDSGGKAKKAVYYKKGPSFTADELLAYYLAT